MGKIIGYFAFNISFILLLYFGLIDKHEFSADLSVFMVWTFIFFSFFLVSKVVIKELSEMDHKRTVPEFIDLSFDFAVLIIIVSSGALITGAFWVIHIILQKIMWNEIKKNNGENHG